MRLRIDSAPLQAYAQRLKGVSKNAFPEAIRQTLNNAAYDVKLNTMPKTAEATFEIRQANFFKANSKVVPIPKGVTNLPSMAAEVGFFSNNLRGRNNRAVEDLEKQEHGGNIPKKDFIAEEGARNPAGLVKSNLRLSNIPKLDTVVQTRNFGKKKGGGIMKVKSKKQQFVRAAIVAKQTKKNFVLGNKLPTGSRTLSKINSITGLRKESILIRRTPVYNVKGGRVIPVTATQFMERASYESQSKMSADFIKIAQRMLNNHLKKKPR